MKETLFTFFIGIILFFSLTPYSVSADGGAFVDYTELTVTIPSQKATVTWDGETETLILSTKIGVENLANMAWIVPLPSNIKPEISEGDIEIFYDLADLFTWERKTPGLGGGLEGEPEVEVIEFKKVDIYDVTTLKATNATTLVSWLNENGYVVPKGALEILQEYCDQEGFYFIANKINLANKYTNLTITETDMACAEIMNARLDEPFLGWFEDIDDKFEYLWNEEEMYKEATYESVKVLVELNRGISTPIEIEFQPPAPFYPLKMSSINDGWTDIDVYIFSQAPVKDMSGILSISQMTRNTPLFKEKYHIDQRYVTKLVYSGDLKELSSDSWFVSVKYNPSLDPVNIRIRERISDILLSMTRIVVYFVIPIAILGFAVIGFIRVTKKILLRVRS